jgi:hypothetical protein
MVLSMERMNKVWPRQTLIRLQGMDRTHTRANRVPTTLARAELTRSPRTRKAKLVVMPHDGQGRPVSW